MCYTFIDRLGDFCTGTYKLFSYAPCRLVIGISFYGFSFCCVLDAIRFSYVTVIGVHDHHPLFSCDLRYCKGFSLLSCCPCFISCTYITIYSTFLQQQTLLKIVLFICALLLKIVRKLSLTFFWFLTIISKKDITMYRKKESYVK